MDHEDIIIESFDEGITVVYNDEEIDDLSMDLTSQREGKKKRICIKKIYQYILF